MAVPRPSPAPPGVPFDALARADLVVDAVYQGGRAGNAGDDPLARLLPVGNQGGFRYRGAPPTPRLVALYTTGGEPNWPDSLDPYSGIFTYYGDNRRPGHGLHETPRRGNLILDATFAASQEPVSRAAVPIFLVFESTKSRRDIRFLGLAVPGAEQLRTDEDLVAVWRTRDGRRFQNYRATFTILDVPVVSRQWLDGVIAGDAVSADAPVPWLQWVGDRVFAPLRAPRVGSIRSRSQQLQADRRGGALLQRLRERCGADPISFEQVAARLWTAAAGAPVTLELTRPTMDGGRDAVGVYYIGPAADRVGMEFALEAKCYSEAHGVGVRELARLISRLRHRQFGVLVTTSFLSAQAYQELRDDGHPVVVLAAADIAEILGRLGISTPAELDRWLDDIFAAPGAVRPSSPR